MSGIGNVSYSSMHMSNYTNKLAFKGKSREEKAENEIEESPQKSASTAKKWGVGIGSYLLPGVGQLVNGEYLKGTCLLVGSIGLAGYLMSKGKVDNFFLGIIKVGSAIDAVANAKPSED